MDAPPEVGITTKDESGNLFFLVQQGFKDRKARIYIIRGMLVWILVQIGAAYRAQAFTVRGAGGADRNF
jgi:hypothetical protein